jgi:hypothetical protein
MDFLMNKEKRMADDGQSKKLKQASKSISRCDWIDKNEIDMLKTPEFSPPPENAGPILLSQTLEFDWDETFIPVSLASINNPLVSFRFHTAHFQAAVTQNAFGIRPLSSEAKKFLTRK